MFDSSVARGAPATFPLNRVITGWTEGLQLMVVGEKRRLWIPEALAYKGQRDPKGMLVFDVELLSMPARAPADVKAPPADAKKTASGLAYKVLQAGNGTSSSESHRHRSRCTTPGWTTDGKMFDSSVVRRTTDYVPAERRHRRVDRRRAADGRGREDAVLDSRDARL